MEIKIRKMIVSDINEFPNEFAMQGWEKPVEQFRKYFEEQEKGLRQVFVSDLSWCQITLRLWFGTKNVRQERLYSGW